MLLKNIYIVEDARWFGTFRSAALLKLCPRYVTALLREHVFLMTNLSPDCNLFFTKPPHKTRNVTTRASLFWILEKRNSNYG